MLILWIFIYIYNLFKKNVFSNCYPDLQCHMIHFILICWFASQETFLIICIVPLNILWKSYTFQDYEMNIKNIYIYFKYIKKININVFAVTFNQFNVSLLNQKALESFTFVPKTFEKYTALCGLKDTVNHSVSPSATPFQENHGLDRHVGT